MRPSAIFSAWARILRGYRPFLSIEVTKECPLKCPGCYAYEPGHLPDGQGMSEVVEWHGEELIRRVMAQVGRYRPLHVSFVGGEPLIRHKELTSLIPQLDKLGIEMQIITSAVLPIPAEWSNGWNVHLVVSIDGLQHEHNSRRTPATYDRVLRNIAGHQVIVHCTILPQFLADPDYLWQFARIWCSRPEVRKIWFSLYTPQTGQYPPERLTAGERTLAINRIAALRSFDPKICAPEVVLDGYRNPPPDPEQCIFAQTTNCLSADLSTPVLPCQIGGQPVCSECGCMAGAGLASVGKIRLGGILKVAHLFAVSRKIGERVQRGSL